MKTFSALTLAAALILPTSAGAAPVYACGGSAMGGSAELLCSHTNPQAPPQTCNFFWTLMTTDNTTDVVEGSFLLAPGSSNAVVYRGVGFSSALANPIIICQGRRS